MLHGSGYTAGDIQLRRNNLAGLSYLMGTGCPALLDGRTGCADYATKQRCQLFYQLKAFCVTHAASSGYDNIRTFQVNGLRNLFCRVNHFCLQCFCCYRRVFFFHTALCCLRLCKASAADRCELNRSGHCQALQNGSAVCRAYKLHTLSGFLNCGYIGHTACAETLCQARCQVFSDLGAGKQNQLRLSFPDVSL